MVGAMLRHMVSLRTLKRDHGWIHTLLEARPDAPSLVLPLSVCLMSTCAHSPHPPYASAICVSLTVCSYCTRTHSPNPPPCPGHSSPGCLLALLAHTVHTRRVGPSLEEAENERMHLLTFLKLRNPGIVFRLGVLLTQGIFFNAFLLAGRRRFTPGCSGVS